VPVTKFCNIQNKEIYNLLNSALIENQMKKERRKKKCSNATKFVLRTGGGICLWTRNRL